MPYATVQDLQDRLGEQRLMQLTDRSYPPLQLVDAAVAQAALDDAEAEIDGYLAGRYALPLASVPGALRVHAITIATYRLLGNAAQQVEIDDYKAAVRYLDAVGKGSIPLFPPAQTPQPAGAGTVIFSPGSKVMGRDSEEAY
jgi:phage gp36-like protein